MAPESTSPDLERELDATLSALSREQLEAHVRGQVRALPEWERERMLDQIRKLAATSPPSAAKATRGVLVPMLFGMLAVVVAVGVAMFMLMTMRTRPAAVEGPSAGMNTTSAPGTATQTASERASGSSDSPPVSEPPVATPPTAGSAPPSGGGEATFSFNSIPAAKVMLDGRPIGSTPLVDFKAAAGTHTVTFVHADKGKKVVMVSVGAGERKVVAVRF